MVEVYSGSLHMSIIMLTDQLHPVPCSNPTTHVLLSTNVENHTREHDMENDNTTNPTETDWKLSTSTALLQSVQTAPLLQRHR